MSNRFFFDGIDVASNNSAINKQPQLVVDYTPYPAKTDLAFRYFAQPSACRTFDPAVWQCCKKLGVLTGYVRLHR